MAVKKQKVEERPVIPNDRTRVPVLQTTGEEEPDTFDEGGSKRQESSAVDQTNNDSKVNKVKRRVKKIRRRRKGSYNELSQPAEHTLFGGEGTNHSREEIENRINELIKLEYKYPRLGRAYMHFKKARDKYKIHYNNLSNSYTKNLEKGRKLYKIAKDLESKLGKHRKSHPDSKDAVDEKLEKLKKHYGGKIKKLREKQKELRKERVKTSRSIDQLKSWYESYRERHEQRAHTKIEKLETKLEKAEAKVDKDLEGRLIMAKKILDYRKRRVDDETRQKNYLLEKYGELVDKIKIYRKRAKKKFKNNVDYFKGRLEKYRSLLKRYYIRNKKLEQYVIRNEDGKLVDAETYKNQQIDEFMENVSNKFQKYQEKRREEMKDLTGANRKLRYKLRVKSTEIDEKDKRLEKAQTQLQENTKKIGKTNDLETELANAYIKIDDLKGELTEVKTKYARELGV